MKLSVLSVLLVAVSVGAIAVEDAQHRLVQQSSVSDEGRRQVAELLGGTMNITADPCNEFFEFACGAYKSPDMAFEPEVNEKLADKAVKMVTEHLAGVDIMDMSVPKWKRGVANMYQLCMKPNKNDFRGDVLIADIFINNHLSGWPMAGSDVVVPAERVAGNMAGMNQAITGMTLATLTPKFVKMNDHDEVHNLLTLNPIQPLVDFDQLTGLPTPKVVNVSELATTVLDTVVLLNDLNVTTDLLISAYNVAEITSRLNNASWATRDWKGSIPNGTVPLGDYQTTYTMPQLLQQFPGVNWPEFMLGFAAQQGGYAAVFSQPIVIPFISYLWDVEAIFQQYHPTDIRNYLVYQFVKSSLDSLGGGETQLNQEQREAMRQFAGGRMGLTRNEFDSANEQECALYAQWFSDGFARIDAELRGYDRQVVQEVNDIASLVAVAYKGMLNSRVYAAGQGGWIAPGKDLDILMRKVDDVARNVGLNDKIFSDDYLNKRFARTVVLDKSSDPYLTWLTTTQILTSNALSTVGQKIDRFQINTPSTLVQFLIDYQFTPTTNAINVQYSSLRSPLFDKSFPRFYTFAAIGRIIASSLGESFAPANILSNAHGDFGDLSVDTITRYTRKSLCFEAQYDQYCIDGSCVEGSKWLGQNLAENFGLHASFYAYQTYMFVSGEDGQNRMPRPFDVFTDSQLFFLSYARAQCSDNSLDQAYLDINMMPRSFRVKGAVANTPDFHKAYKCDAGEVCEAII